MRVAGLILVLWVLLFPIPSYAYVGPGMGMGAVGVILGIFMSIILAFFGIFWYPLKRIIRKFRKAKPKQNV